MPMEQKVKRFWFAGTELHMIMARNSIYLISVFHSFPVGSQLFRALFVWFIGKYKQKSFHAKECWFLKDMFKPFYLYLSWLFSDTAKLMTVKPHLDCITSPYYEILKISIQLLFRSIVVPIPKMSGKINTSKRFRGSAPSYKFRLPNDSSSAKNNCLGRTACYCQMTVCLINLVLFLHKILIYI